jgi:hypothetical protein
MMAPAHSLVPLDPQSPVTNGLQWSTRHAWLKQSYDGKLTAWAESDAYETIAGSDGKLSHQARIVPPYSPTNPPPPKMFYKLVGEWNPWDPTISGR